MTPAEFSKASKMWASGEYTLQDISDEVGVTVSWLSQKFKAAGIVRGQDQKIAQDIKKRALQMTIADAALELKKYVPDAQKIPVSGSNALMRKTLHIFQTLVESGKSIASADEEFKAILTAMKVLESGWKINKEVLKLDKEEVNENELPVLEIIRMTEKDVIEERARQLAEEAEFNGEGNFDDLPLLGEDGLDSPDDEDDIVDEGIDTLTA